MNDQKKKKKLSPGQIIAIVIAVALFAPQLFYVVLILGIIALPIYAAYRISKSKGSTPKRTPDKFDECPQPLFCFHNDKAEHHVRKGKEIDPWDRPDIDISKYQHKK